MFLLRNMFCMVILLTATCAALNENGGGSVDISSLSAIVKKRDKRGIDVSMLLRNLLLQSAQSSDFKANLVREKARPRPTTRRPTTTPRPTAPRRMPDPVFNIFAFKNKFIPFNPIDYGDYDDTMSSPPTPAPRQRPRPRPTTTMPPPTTTAAPQPQPRPQPMPRRRPPPPPLPPAAPIHRFGNLGYNQPLSADYGYYQYPNLGLGNDYDYEQDQQPPAPPARRPNPAAASRRRPAPPSTPAPTPATPAATPRRAPAPIRNRVAYQYAQPADPSYDDFVPNAAQDDAVDYTDATNADEDNAANSNSAAANTDADADAGDGSDYADDTNAPINNDNGDDANADDQSTAPLPPDPPRQQQQQQDFPSSNYGVGYKGGVGSSAISYVEPRGSYEFRNQFADFKTSFDGGYPQHTHNDGQYYSYYQ